MPGEPAPPTLAPRASEQANKDAQLGERTTLVENRNIRPGFDTCRS
jgi:hypothetical protein